MVLTDSVRLFRFDKINHRLRLYCTISRSSSVNCTVYLSLNLGYCCNSRQHPWEAFLHTFRMCIAPSWRKWEDVRYSTFLGRRHKSRWTHSSQTRSPNKTAVIWSYFRDFVGAQKIEHLTESKFFFAEGFQIISRFVLAKKSFGVRCTLNVICILKDSTH